MEDDADILGLGGAHRVPVYSFIKTLFADSKVS
jgi:hypothetical protein